MFQACGELEGEGSACVSLGLAHEAENSGADAKALYIRALRVLGAAPSPQAATMLDKARTLLKW